MEIALENVWFTYDGVNYVIQDASITFKSQGLYMIVGPNGSGKTTLLKIVALLHKPSKGRVLVNGVSYWDLSSSSRDGIRRSIVYVHDKPILVRGSLEYNVRLGLELRGEKVDNSYLEELLERYKLSSIRKVNVRNLSAGQKRLVSILRALTLKPEALILDEPFNHLDREKAGMLVEDLSKLSKERMVVVATHYMTRELWDIAKEVHEIIAGNVKRLKP